MKIAQSVTRYFPAIGGVEDYVRNLSERIVKQGHQVSVVTTNSSHHQKYQKLNVPDKEIINGVQVIRHQALPFACRKYICAPGMISSLLKEKFDVFHGHSYMYHSADASLVAARFKNKPFIFTPYLAGENNPSVFGKTYRKIFGNSLFNADCVIVISPFEARLVESWGFKPKKIQLISPGVNLDEFDNAPDCDIYKKYGITQENKVLFVGRVDYMKGVDLLVLAAKEIVKQIKDICFVIVGPDFGYMQTVKKMIKEYNLEKYFSLIGPVERKDLVSFYKGATVFAFPSRYEAFGIVAAEAMAAKKPVVATNFSSIPDVVVNNKTGFLFSKDDAIDFAEKLKQILRDTSLQRQMGECGYYHVKENFDWDASAKRLLKIYEKKY